MGSRGWLGAGSHQGHTYRCKTKVSGQMDNGQGKKNERSAIRGVGWEKKNQRIQEVCSLHQDQICSFGLAGSF